MLHTEMLCARFEMPILWVRKLRNESSLGPFEIASPRWSVVWHYTHYYGCHPRKGVRGFVFASRISIAASKAEEVDAKSWIDAGRVSYHRGHDLTPTCVLVSVIRATTTKTGSIVVKLLDGTTFPYEDLGMDKITASQSVEICLRSTWRSRAPS